MTLLVLIMAIAAAVPNAAERVDPISAPVGTRWTWHCDVQDDLGSRFAIHGAMRKAPKGDLSDGFELASVSSKDGRFRWLGWFSADDRSMPRYLNSVAYDKSGYRLTFQNVWGYMPQEININRDVVLTIAQHGKAVRGEFRIMRDKKIRGASRQENRAVSASGPCMIQEMS